MSDTNKYSTLPENADKLLFAEDFVNHILLNHKLPLLSSGIADHRDFIYNAFNLQVGVAANHVANQLKYEMFDEFVNLILQDSDISSFTNYAIPFRLRTLEIMLPIEFGANIFLQFCVKISTMAVEFYIIDFLEAPGLAVEYIISILDGINMVDEGGWKALHLVAAQHFKNTIDNYLTPEPASDSNLLTSETDYRTSDFMRSSSSSGEDSEGSRSPDHEMNGGDNQDEHPEKLTDEFFCIGCITAMCTSSEGQASSSSACKHDEKTEASRLPDQEMNSVDNLNELPEKLTDGDFCTKCFTDAVHSQDFADSSDNYLTPESASDSDLWSTESEWETTDDMSSSSSSGEEADSEGSRSPHHEMNGGDNQDEHPEKLTDDNITAMSASLEGQASSSSVNKHVENTEASRSPDHEMIGGDYQDEHPEKLTDDFCTKCITEMCTSSEGQASLSTVCKHVEKTEASCLLDQEMNSVDNLNELPEKLTDGDFCTMCITAMSTSSEGQASSSLVCNHVLETIDVVSENIASFSDNTSDSVSSGASEEKNSEDSFHSFEETSSEEDTSKRKKRKKLRKKSSFLHSKDSDSDSEKS